MHPLDEANFEASIYHYFLWKSEQEVKREEAARYQLAANAARTIQTMRSPANDGGAKNPPAGAKTPPVAAAATAAASKPSPKEAPVAAAAVQKKPPAATPSVAAAAKTPPKSAMSVRDRPMGAAVAPGPPRSAKYMKIASLLAAEFPYLVPRIPPAQSQAQPEVYHRYAMYNQFQRDISGLTAKNHQLTTQLDESNKRDLVAAEEPAKKKRKHRFAPVSTKMQVGSRKDVPDDVKQLVSLLRKTARDEKAKAERKMSRLVSEAAEARDKAWRVKQAAAKTAQQEKLNQASVQQLAPKKTAGPVFLFEDRFKELEDFKKANGHCRVPTRTPGLGRWVQEIRQSHKYLQEVPTFFDSVSDFKYAPNALNQERIARLEAIGFEWRVAPPRSSWDDRFEELKKFKEKFGHLKVTRSGKYATLGEWVKMQRKLYKAKDKRIVGERARKLDELGFVWSDLDFKQYTFEERLEQCRDFRREHGHLHVPPAIAAAKLKDQTEVSKEENSFRIWAQRQRDDYRKFHSGMKSSLDTKRIKTLNEMGFVWEKHGSGRGRQKKDDSSSVRTGDNDSAMGNDGAFMDTSETI